MSSLQRPDLAGLAMLARNGDRELRPVLLMLHTREFVSASRRDRRAVTTYEALALGLIPLVPDDVVADVSAMLRNVPETPARVVELLAARRRACSLPDPRHRAASATLTGAEIVELIMLTEPEIDRALAGNLAVLLDARARSVLVGRATRDRALAQALLARSELSAGERGVLFAFAEDEPARDNIRDQLERATAVAAPSLPSLSAWRRTRLLRAATKADLPGLLAELGTALGLSPTPAWQLDEPAEAELFALALVAVGLSVEDCVRVLLTADRRIAASVPIVFRLRQVCRTTPRPSAWSILGASATARKTRAPKAGPSRTKAAEGARASSSTEPVRTTQAPPASAPAGRRSRSTTGRDRT